MPEPITRSEAGDGIAVLRLARPPVNALTPAFLGRFEVELAALDGDPDIRAVVLASDLPVFSAGVDLKAARHFTDDDQTAMVDALNTGFCRLYGLSKPVIAAAGGAAIAGGLFLLLAADYVVAAEGGLFGLTEVRAGIGFPVAPLEIARAELTPAAFRKLLLSGRNVDAETAHDMGFVDEVTPSDAVMARALAAAGDYATIPPLTFAKVKAQMRAPALAIIRSAIAAGSDPVRVGWFGAETDAAMSALLAAAAKR